MSKNQREKSTLQSELENFSSFVQKHDVLQSFLPTLLGLTYGQLLRRDAEPAQKDLRPVISDCRPKSNLVAPISSVLRRLRLVKVALHGTQSQGLLDSGAVPNLLSTRLLQNWESKQKHLIRKQQSQMGLSQGLLVLSQSRKFLFKIFMFQWIVLLSRIHHLTSLLVFLHWNDFKHVSTLGRIELLYGTGKRS